MIDKLGVRNLKKFGMRLGAYDGGNKRRFCFFEDAGNGNERRHEFDTKGERDAFAMKRLKLRIALNSSSQESVG